MTREEEQRCIARTLKGDAEAFAPLVRAYEPGIYGLCFRMARNTEDAQDLTQEIFLRAYRALGSFRGESRFSVWLYRLGHNVCLDFLRRRKRQWEVSLTQTDEDGQEQELEIPDGRYEPDALLARAELRRAVRLGLMALPEDQRRILLLREIGGLRYDEIAAVLELEEGTVKSRIFRARKKLCEVLRKQGNIFEDMPSKKAKEV